MNIRFRKFIRVAALSTVALAMVSCAESQKHENKQHLGADKWPAIISPVKKDNAIEEQIVSLVSQMSLEEKVGQIIQPEIKYVTPEDIKTYHIGSILNGGGSLPNRNKHATPKEWLDLADSFYDASMDTTDGKIAIPIIWGSDAVHGHNNVIGATIFPHNIGLGAMHNPALIQEIGGVTAREVRVTGIDWTFAPTLAVVQNDRWGRTYESYSEDPAVVKSYAGEMVKGLQGVPGTDEFLDVNHVVATAKHFVGDGGTEGGDDQGDAKVSEAELRDIHGAGYISALEAGVQTAMASFSSWNGEKLHGSKYLLTDVLKNRMGLDGLVVGDWNGHGQVPGCTNASCAASINAGVDLVMVPQDWKELYKNTLAQARAGEIAIERLDDAVSRILRVKIRAGLFSKGRPSDRGIAGKDGIIGSKGHRDIARRAVRQSLVLLKNKDSILPLNPAQSVLVAGDGADNVGKQSGGWTITWQGTGNINSDFPGSTSVFDGIRKAVDEKGGKATYSLDGSYTVKPDVAVVVFGENPYAEFQGDRDTLEFEPGDKKSLNLVKKLKADGIPVVSVFLSGRPMWMNPEINASDAFVAAWLPGSEGIGIADVLIADASGKARHDFKGSLSFSWPKTPLQDILNPHHERYDPLFKLGYGLTYQSPQAEFAMLDEDVEGVETGEKTDIKIFVGRPPAPWQVYAVYGEGEVLLSGPYIKTPSQTLTITAVDKDVQEDALAISWNGTSKASVEIRAFETKEPFNYSELLKSGGVITVDLKLDSLPEKEMYMKLVCGDDCEQRINLSNHLRALVGQGWQSVSVALSCFSMENNDMTALTTPFGLETSGRAEIAFANVVVKSKGSSSFNCEP